MVKRLLTCEVLSFDRVQYLKGYWVEAAPADTWTFYGIEGLIGYVADSVVENRRVL